MGRRLRTTARFGNSRHDELADVRPMDEVIQIFNDENPDLAVNRKYATVILSNARRKILPKLREVLEWYEQEITRG